MACWTERPRGAGPGIPERTQARERREDTTGRRRHSSVPTLAPPGRSPQPRDRGASSASPQDHLRRAGRGRGRDPGRVEPGRPRRRRREGERPAAQVRGPGTRGRGGLRGARAARLRRGGSRATCPPRSAKESPGVGDEGFPVSLPCRWRQGLRCAREGSGQGRWEGS